MTKSFIIPLLALAAFGLSACKPSVHSLQELEFGQHELETDAPQLRSEARALVQHYLDTGDARYATPTYGMTMLHLAAMNHRMALVKQLLAEGADPNALMKLHQRPADGPDAKPALLPAASPLLMATRYNSSDAYGQEAAQDALHVARVLIEAGADPNYHDPEGLGVLACCGHGISWGDKDWEACALALLDMGARPSRADILETASTGAYTLLMRLLDSPEGQALRHDGELLQELTRASFFMRDCAPGEDKGWLGCVRLVMSKPVDVNKPGHYGDTLLGEAACNLYFHNEEAEAAFREDAPFVEFLALLLAQGADPCTPCSATYATTPADYFARSPKLLAALAQRGFTITPPAHRFTREGLVAELSTLPLEAVREDEVRAHWEALASALCDPAAEPDSGSAPQHELATKALRLMQRADAARLSTLLMERPCWQADSPAWSEPQGEPLRWLRALHASPEVVLPARWLTETARAAEAAGNEQAARMLVLLLERCPAEETAALLDELCADAAPLALRAPAWTVKLHREGLPALTCSEVTKWLEEHHGSGLYGEASYEEDVQLMLKAEHAVSSRALQSKTFPIPQRYSERDQPHEEEEQALRRLGAPLAAELYAAAAADAPEAQKFAALLQLELAANLHLWKHRQHVLHFKKP